MTGTDTHNFLFIGELAQSTGADPKTIRFYERAGLLMPPRHGKFRTYLATDVQRLKNVLRLRKLGVPIAEIRPLLDDAGNGDVLAAQSAAQTLARHLANLNARRAELENQIAETQSALQRLDPQ